MAYQNGNHDNRALVVLQLSGGNDTLNTVTPYNDSLYFDYRQTVRLRPRQGSPHRGRPRLQPQHGAGQAAVGRGEGGGGQRHRATRIRTARTSARWTYGTRRCPTTLGARAGLGWRRASWIRTPTTS